MKEIEARKMAEGQETKVVEDVLAVIEEIEIKIEEDSEEKDNFKAHNILYG